MRYSSKEYIRALGRDSSLAVIPIMTASKALDVSRPAVERMLGDGRLQEIVIDKTRSVQAKEVAARLREMDDQLTTTYRALRNLARKQKTTTYAPLMEVLGLDHRLSLHRNQIAKILDKVSRTSHEHKEVLLSALVCRKSGDRLPGDGFFEMASELGYSWTNREKFVREQIDLVWDRFGRK
jgi:hypothetical protein